MACDRQRGSSGRRMLSLAPPCGTLPLHTPGMLPAKPMGSVMNLDERCLLALDPTASLHPQPG